MWIFPTRRICHFVTSLLCLDKQILHLESRCGKDLEELTRRWALREKELYVICGPLFFQEGIAIGNGTIPVPRAYFRIICDMTPPRFSGRAPCFGFDIEFTGRFRTDDAAGGRRPGRTLLADAVAGPCHGTPSETGLIPENLPVIPTSPRWNNSSGTEQGGTP